MQCDVIPSHIDKSNLAQGASLLVLWLHMKMESRAKSVWGGM